MGGATEEIPRDETRTAHWLLKTKTGNWAHDSVIWLPDCFPGQLQTSFRGGAAVAARQTTKTSSSRCWFKPTHYIVIVNLIHNKFKKLTGLIEGVVILKFIWRASNALCAACDLICHTEATTTTRTITMDRTHCYVDDTVFVTSVQTLRLTRSHIQLCRLADLFMFREHACRQKRFILHLGFICLNVDGNSRIALAFKFSICERTCTCMLMGHSLASPESASIMNFSMKTSWVADYVYAKYIFLRKLTLFAFYSHSFVLQTFCTLYKCTKFPTFSLAALTACHTWRIRHFLMSPSRVISAPIYARLRYISFI